MFGRRRLLISTLTIPVLFVLAGGLPLRSETLPKGTEISIQLEKDVAWDSNSAKQFSATLTLPVFAEGREMVPLGSRASTHGEIRGNKKTIFLSPRQIILPNGQRVDFFATVSEINHKKLQADKKEGTVDQKGDPGAAAQQAGEVGATGAIIRCAYHR